MKRIILILVVLAMAMGQALAYTGFAVGNTGANAAIYQITGDTAIAVTLSPAIAIKLYGCRVVDVNTAYACGTGGGVIKTINGGTTWSTLTTGITDSLFSITVSPGDQNILYACGSGGAIIKTTNGGTSWASLTSGSTKSLRSIKAINDTTVYSVGQDTTILKCANGSSWAKQTVPAYTSGMLNTVDFFGTTGYISGEVGAILKSTSNTPWQKQVTGISNEIISINLISATGIFALYANAGVPYYFYNTTGTWTAKTMVGSFGTSKTSVIKAQKTMDQFNAYVIIENNKRSIWKTANSGNSWKSLIFTGDTLRALDLLIEPIFNNRYISTLFTTQDIDSTFSYYTAPVLANNFGWFGLYVYSYGTTPRYKITIEGAPTLSDPFIAPSDSIVADSCGMTGYVNQWLTLHVPPGQYFRLKYTGLSGNGANTTTTSKLYSWGQ
jgi:photosystem II stability/assembly factor-like uncharacterized protein